MRLDVKKTTCNCFCLWTYVYFNTRSHDLMHPPLAKTFKYQGSFRINGPWTYNTLPRIIRQVEMLSKFKIKLSAILNSNIRGTCCLYNLINFLVLMSLFLCCVRAPFKLALLNWMPLQGPKLTF